MAGGDSDGRVLLVPCGHCHLRGGRLCHDGVQQFEVRLGRGHIKLRTGQFEPLLGMKICEKGYRELFSLRLRRGGRPAFPDNQLLLPMQHRGHCRESFMIAIHMA